MLSLTNDGPTAVFWHGKTYSLDLAFDRVLLFFQLIEDDSLSSNEKTLQAIQIFLGRKNESIDHLLGRLPKDDSFFNRVFGLIQREIRDEPYGRYEDADDINDSVSSDRIFDYQRDAGAIYASFWQDYGIDLHKQIGKLQWCEFKALFDGLSSKTYFKKIIEIRQKEINSDMSSEEKTDILDAQRYFALKDPRIEQIKNNAASLASMFGVKKGGK
ncbi:Gp15 family bacteriophage protein [Lactobacillus amylovorus]|uniref:Gp15 family bacteriophage protein n=1 Tax=Lactobacillus amylovorus TaxID=1604 RepID=UPI00232DEADB|nr:Gp15 family bacteriophage protein [Lactobacillus amylovorus]MDB6229202.1 bacteriophage Gp15 family protein [Lactobacillus amylovorus]